MLVLPVTACTAAILALLYIALSARVVMGRAKSKISLGDDAATSASYGDGSATPPLLTAIRGHGNFAEYVPLALILLAIVEASGAAYFLCLILAAMLLIGRILHPFGLARPAPNAARAAGVMLTWAMILVSSLIILVKAV